MDVNILSILADYYERGEIEWRVLRDEIAADELYCDLADSQHGIQQEFVRINAVLIAEGYITRTEKYASGIGPEAYAITPLGIAELKKEVEIIKQNSKGLPPIKDRVDAGIRQVNDMLRSAGLPTLDDPSLDTSVDHSQTPGNSIGSPEPEKKPWSQYIAIALLVLLVIWFIDDVTGRHIYNTILGK